MNYVILVIGVFAVLAAIILIFLDRLKGEDIYFNMDVKEQEIKKVIEDADEIISELNYTSEMVVKEIEEKMRNLREDMKHLNTSEAKAHVTENKVPQAIKPTVVMYGKKKKIVNDNIENSGQPASKLKQKQQSVFEYAAQGMSVTDIAKHMNIGQGEVMLILSLKNEVE